MTKVSIIVPVYNTEKYLDKCLDSLVNQTLKDIEIIVVNDGSTDNSDQIIKDYLKKYKNVIYIKDTNHGQGHARNIGLTQASGEYVCFVDSDDYVSLTMLEELYDNSYDVIVGDIIQVIGNKKVYFNNYHNFSKKDKVNLMLSHPGPVVRLYRRKLFSDVKFLENVYYEDLATMPLIAKKVKKVKHVAKPLYYYLIRTDSTMRKANFNSKLDDIYIVLEHLTKHLKDYPAELEYLYIEHLLYSSTLRFLNYEDSQDRIAKNIDIIKKKYPNWRKNPYLNKKSMKFKLITILAYKNKKNLLKIIKRITGK